MEIFGMKYISGNSTNDLSNKLMDLLANYRSNIRSAAKLRDLGQIFKLSDELRDIHLPELGVKLMDDGNVGLWKIS